MVNAMKKKSRKFAISGIKQVASIVLVLSMIFALVGCGEDSESDAKMTTEDFGTEAEVDGVQEPNQEIDEGVLLPDTTTEEVTTEEATSEEQDQNPTSNSGSYTYDVDGVKVTLRTNIDDYIVYQPQWDSYDIDLAGIAKSLGLEPIESNEPVSEQTCFKTSDGGCRIYFDDLKEQDFYGIYSTFQQSGETNIDFQRCDISDDSIKTYWISLDSSATYKINYEQIVLFTLLMENAAFAPSEDWAEEVGLHTSTGPSFFYVNK